MTISINSPPKPRRRPEPSQRDQQIYLEYQTTGRSQEDLAKEHGLTQCRISQIIRRVEAWLAGEPVQSPTSGHPRSGSIQDQDDAEPTLDLGPGTLDRALQRGYLNFVCRQAIRQFQADRVTVTHKKGTRGDKAIDETTERREPPSIQCLKVVVQTTAQLARQSRDGHRCEAVVVSRGAKAVPSRGTREAGLSKVQSQEGADSTLDSAALDRAAVEAWILENRNQGIYPSTFFDAADVRDLVNLIVREPASGSALKKLAPQTGKILVEKKEGSYHIPRQDGWYTGLYDIYGQFLFFMRDEEVGQRMSIPDNDEEDDDPRGADI